MDPIVIERSLAFLDVAAGGGNASVSKAWRSVCGSWALWHDLSQPLRKWRNIAVDEFCRLNRCVAQPVSFVDNIIHGVGRTQRSIAHAKRTSLTRDELCSQTWRFRFKRAAGEEWHQPARRPLLDGQPPRDDHLLRRRQHGTGRHLGARGRSQVALGPRSQGAAPAEASPAASGSSVRVVVDGRDVPTLKVARHPVHKGFMMESCWALYTAFPMPAPGQGLDDDDLSVTVEEQVDEVDSGTAARWRARALRTTRPRWPSRARSREPTAAREQASSSMACSSHMPFLWNKPPISQTTKTSAASSWPSSSGSRGGISTSVGAWFEIAARTPRTRPRPPPTPRAARGRK